METARSLCILHGNCQGETLAALLGASPEFSAAYRVEYYVNFTRQEIPEENLSRCALFLHQHLGSHWGDVSTGSLKARLPRQTTSICYPNMLFTGYWPFWSSRSGFEFSDSLLDGLLDRGLSGPEVLHVALKGNLARMYDLGALLANTLAMERDKEALGDVKYVDMMESLFRTERLFNTVNHPRARLMLHAADSVLSLLSMPPLPEDFKAALPEISPEFELPIHPQVARFHGLCFGLEGTTYNVFGQAMTHADYTRLYIDCKLAGRADFTAYLQGA